MSYTTLSTIMFVHTVLFEIHPKEVSKYHRDNRLWAQYARKARGFIGYLTMKRKDGKNQYASVYRWKKESDHKRFMKKFHDWLVNKSQAKVKVLGYYNMRIVEQV